MQNLTSDKPSFREKFRRVLDNELTGTMWRFLKGAALISAAPAFGIGGLIVVGVALVGLSLYRNHVIASYDKLEWLKQYKSEVAAAVGKDESSLKLGDLEVAAKQINGGHNAIQETLDNLKQNLRINTITSIAGGAATTALAAAAPMVLSVQFINWLGGAIIGGMVSNITYFLVEEAAQKVAGEKKPYRLNQSIKALNLQSRSGSVSPEMVMNAFVEAQPILANAVKEYYKKPYAELLMVEKQEVVARYRDIIPAKEWAEAINAGQRSATALAIDTYDIAALPTDIPPLAPSPEPKLALEEPLYSFAAKLDEQRSAAATKSLTRH
jgi:hypothetical protein